jgi:NAD(P)-dependent dehydrogenase (short-subunit alcohol dehydrogenase family)
MKRKVLILGASSDIGMSIAKIYLRNKWSVVAHGNSNFDRLLNISEHVTSFKLDMFDAKNIHNFIDNNQFIFDKVNVVVNCLGFMEPKQYKDIDYEHLLKTFNINLFSPLLFNSKMIDNMLDQNWGRFVNLGSIGVKFGGGVNSICYSMSKHSLEFMPSDHKKWARHNVFYNTIRVGVTDTKIHKIDKSKNMDKRISLIPIGRMAKTEEISKFVYWLGSNENTYITGQIISVAGGE